MSAGEPHHGTKREGRRDPQLTRESAFRFWTSEKIRLEDVDGFDHVNNVTFAVYAESGRLEFLDRVAATEALGAGRHWELLEATLRLRERTHYPGEIRVGTGVRAIARSSVTLGQGLFEGSTCVATVEALVGLLDTDTDHAVALPAAVRHALEAYTVAR